MTTSVMRPDWSSPAVQDHATSAGPVFVFVASMVIIVPLVGYLAFMLRHTRKSPERQAELVARKFDGRPEVYVGKSQWSLDYNSIRDVAWRCGYVEGGTPGRRFHTFRRRW